MTNLREVVEWWRTSRELQSVVLVPSGIDDSDEDSTAARVSRAKQALAALAMENDDVQDAPIVVDPCGVSVLIAVTN